MQLEFKRRSETDISCPSGKFDICGTLLMEKRRYTLLEEELERTKNERDKYQHYFSVLLEGIKSSFYPNLIVQVFKNSLLQIPQVKAAYYFQEDSMLSVWIFIEEEDWEGEDRIYEAYGDLLSDFSDYNIEIKLLRLWGRKPEDLLPLGGTKILGE